MPDTSSPFILVDGSSYLFRAYHALPPLTNSKGTPTGAMYGVLNMIKKLVEEHGSEHIAVVFDTKGKNFRHTLFPEYKANRPEMPEELAVQIKPLHAIIQAQGIPLIAIPGYEADDVIGTLARQAQEKGWFTLISTGDKDFAQLVNPKIHLINTMRNTKMDEKGVLEKFGVRPNQIIDYLALIGDSVDNVPGVPKVGPKTAAKWLAQYECLDNIIEHADEIKGKVGENLRNALEQLSLSKTLVTIKEDVPLECHLDDLTLQLPDTSALKTYYQEFEFNSWLKELDQTVPSSPKVTYACIQQETDLKKIIEVLSQCTEFAFDTETTSLDPMEAQLVGVSLCAQDLDAVYIPLGHQYDHVPEQISLECFFKAITPILKDPNKTIIGQNLKYDLHVLARYGVKVDNAYRDTMLASYVYQSGTRRHDMDTLARDFLGQTTITYEEVAGKGAKQLRFDQVLIEKATPYAAEDAQVTFALNQVLWEKLSKAPSLVDVYLGLELPLVDVLLTMERNGVCIDASMLEQQSQTIGKRLDELEAQVHILAGQPFNLSSPKQLQTILFEKLELPVLEKTPKGQASTSESVLVQLSEEYELPKLLLEYRSLSKLKSTYTDKLPQQINSNTSRVHTSYHQAVAATGRLSSSDPNLQNIPIRSAQGREIRQAFIAPEGFKLLAADYSQIELRIMAHLSQDPSLLKAFAQGQDIHRFTAHEIFDVSLDEVTTLQRRRAKAINFGLIYGMSAFGLAKQLGIERSQAGIYMDQYFERYPGVKRYMHHIQESAQEKGYVETLSGRRFYLPDIRSKNAIRKRAAMRTAINAPMQGTAADIIKKAMIQIHPSTQAHCDQFKMIMQVHDELIFEVAQDFIPQAQKWVVEHMEGAMKLSIPLVVQVGIGDNWDQAH